MIWCPCRVVKLATSTVGLVFDTALQWAAHKMPAPIDDRFDIFGEDD